MRARVTVTLKPGVLDPQGEAIVAALKDLGFADVEAARVGKIIDLKLSGAPENAEARIAEMADALLANPVMENFDVAITAGGEP